MDYRDQIYSTKYSNKEVKPRPENPKGSSFHQNPKFREQFTGESQLRKQEVLKNRNREDSSYGETKQTKKDDPKKYNNSVFEVSQQTHKNNKYENYESKSPLKGRQNQRLPEKPYQRQQKKQESLSQAPQTKGGASKDPVADKQVAEKLLNISKLNTKITQRLRNMELKFEKHRIS